MRFLLTAMLLLLAPPVAVAQSKERDYRSLIEVGADEDGQVATSIKAADVKERRGYSPGSEVVSAFWVEARKRGSGPTQVFLVGERLRYILPSEAPKTKSTTYGPWDPPDPVHVGSPWKEADLRYRGSEIQCISDQHWCWQVWFLEVSLPEDVVQSVVTNPKKKEVPLSLSKRRRVEWRTPRDELIATLDALGVLAEFSQASGR
jgi:hypothetical protein